MENQSEIKELLIALCKAQSEYPDIPKTRTGQEGHRKFKYADLNDIHKATRQINAKHGLSTPHETTDTHLITRLYHAPSGQFLKTQLPIRIGENPKHTGATITYLKRYNIQSLLDISTEEDLDSINISEQVDKNENISGILVTEPQLKRLYAISQNKGWTTDQCKFYIKSAWNLESSKDMDRKQYEELIFIIENKSYISAIKELHDRKPGP